MVVPQQARRLQGGDDLLPDEAPFLDRAFHATKLAAAVHNVKVTWAKRQAREAKLAGLVAPPVDVQAGQRMCAADDAPPAQPKSLWQQGWEAITHPVQTLENAQVAWGSHSRFGYKVISGLTHLTASMNDPQRNPVTAAFGKALRDGIDGFVYGVRSTLNLERQTLSSLLKGDWEGVKRYGGALAEGVVKGWIWGSIRTVGHLAWGVVKTVTPIGLLETGPAWWNAIKDARAGKRGGWDVAFTTLLLAANLLGIYGGVQALSRPNPSYMDEVRPVLVEEVDPAFAETARLAWESMPAKDIPPDVASRLPADALSTRAASELASLAKGEALASNLVEAVQTMKSAMALGERVPTVEESVPPDVFQLIDEIARNQVFGEGERLVIGKYVSQQTGYIGAARSGGGLYYNTNPAVWNALQDAFGPQAGEIAWLINQRVLELYAYEKPPAFVNQGIDPEIEAVKDVWNNPGKAEYANARFWEIRWLRSQGFWIEPILDDAGNAIGFRFIPPGGRP